MFGGSLYLPQKENMDGGNADMTEKTQKLKPCPFCGGEAHLVYTIGRGLWMAECGECEIETPIKDSESDAIAAWNRRAPQCEKE